MLLSETPEQISTPDSEITMLRGQLVGRRDKLQAIATGEGKQKMAGASAAMQQWFVGQDTIRDLAKRNGMGEARELSKGRVRELVTELNKNLNELAVFNEKFMDQSAMEAARQYEQARMMLLAATAIVLLLGAGAGIWISTSASAAALDVPSRWPARLRAAISTRKSRSNRTTRSRIWLQR